MDGTYEINLHCNNCGDVKLYEVEKGVRVSSIECENCGLKSMVRETYANYRNASSFIRRQRTDDLDEEDLSD